MQTLAEVISNYVRETRRLESLPSSTETTFYQKRAAAVRRNHWNIGGRRPAPGHAGFCAG
jgi:hypothetical protein